MTHMTCYCCGTEITAPQFHNGNAYGWSCIRKVAPNQKRNRKDTWVAAETKIVENQPRAVFYEAILADGTKLQGYNPKSMGVEVNMFFGKGMVCLKVRQGRVYKNIDPNKYK